MKYKSKSFQLLEVVSDTRVSFIGVSFTEFEYVKACCKSILTYGGQLTHEWPLIKTALLKMHEHNTTKDKVNMFAIFICCKKEAVEIKITLFFYF